METSKSNIAMTEHILFIQGAGERGYEGDIKLVDSLRESLGAGYEVHYPEMPTEEDPYFGSGWPERIAEHISLTKGAITLVGHSLGASMLLKYLSENKTENDIYGVFLLAPPFWTGNEDWKQPLKLQEGFSGRLPKEIPFFFYHCKDDDVVPYEHFEIYKKQLPWAVFREMSHGGHQLDEDLTLVANDIRPLL
jgi:predicted alpha/beta hydrolase family esterase